MTLGSTIVNQMFGRAPTDMDTFNSADSNLKAFVKVLDEQLAKTAYLVGAEITLADIIMGSFLNVHFTLRFEESFRSTVPRLTAWFEGLIKTEPFVKTYGEIKLCAKERLPKPKKEEKKPKEEKKDEKKKDKKDDKKEKKDDKKDKKEKKEK